MPTERRRVFSIGAWAPALRTMVNSSVGPCGCLVGVYQAWGGDTMSVVDLPSAHCTHRHRQGDVVGEVAEMSGATPTTERH